MPCAVSLLRFRTAALCLNSTRSSVEHSGRACTACDGLSRWLLLTGAVPAQVWWRAQAAAYIIRPNNHTMAKIRRLRMNPKLHNVWQHGRAATHLEVPYPLPPGTISMHVRRGPRETCIFTCRGNLPRRS